MKNPLLLALTAALATTASADHPALDDALAAWATKYEPLLLTAAQRLFQGDFSWDELGQLAETASTAAQSLKGVLKGRPRAKIAQTVLRLSATEAIQLLPAPERQLAAWVLPLLEGPAVEALIEAAFRRLFPSAAPVVDAPEVAAGGIQ